MFFMSSTISLSRKKIFFILQDNTYYDFCMKSWFFPWIVGLHQWLQVEAAYIATDSRALYFFPFSVRRLLVLLF